MLSSESWVCQRLVSSESAYYFCQRRLGHFVVWIYVCSICCSSIPIRFSISNRGSPRLQTRIRCRSVGNLLLPRSCGFRYQNTDTSNTLTYGSSRISHPRANPSAQHEEHVQETSHHSPHKNEISAGNLRKRFSRRLCNMYSQRMVSLAFAVSSSNFETYHFCSTTV